MKNEKLSNYHINISYSEKEQGYIADIPDLKYCSVFDLTEEEAISEILQAKAAWLDAAKIEGKPIVEPRYRPAIYQIVL
ncbi:MULTISPECIES: type II toxin-antitoxin system HicB family antitoxin [Nostoc]|uniref:Type II toxin-antitoxin system HicB family antitoxin n=1 Tax=Nostoc paludosum FACHB-159 TaxID=2692908 RepID=A0ABR8K9P6_9NOSO|nr:MULTISPECIES: type II toxin-antitoxin system HicB family antitoxin [Nostoc]MBD2679949.1 type II toxin-antitoxin system HicB family antitoxin [Nostoc sp. FACHB-857]MBD2736204.1 type II toxin-antitoxin system HicB family antitoxin [Nostoc paludosum FACHB-159]